MIVRPLQCPRTLVKVFVFLVVLYQKGGKETILEEELEFKGIEEEEEEESVVDIDRSSAEGDKEKGEGRLSFYLITAPRGIHH